MQEYCIKSVFTGNCNVGKSSIITQYADNSFDDFIKSTIGIDFRLKTICYNNVKIKLQLWDTAGHEKYQSLTNTYYRGIYLFFIVCCSLRFRAKKKSFGFATLFFFELFRNFRGDLQAPKKKKRVL